MFAAEGSRIILVDVDGDALQGIVAEIGADQAASVLADVSDGEQMQTYVVAAMEKFGGGDIALLNADIKGKIMPIAEYPKDLFYKVMTVNVRGVFLGLKYVIPAKRSRGEGNIVITSSTAGTRGSSGMSAFITSKHPVIGFMWTAALEGAEDNIRVNTVNPAPIDTRMIASIEEQKGLPTGDRSNRPWPSTCRCSATAKRMEWHGRCCSSAATTARSVRAAFTWLMAAFPPALCEAGRFGAIVGKQ